MSTPQLASLNELGRRLAKTLDQRQAQYATKSLNAHRRLIDGLTGLHVMATTPNPMDSTGAHLIKVSKASDRLRDEIRKTREDIGRTLQTRRAEVQDSIRVVAGIRQDQFSPEIRGHYLSLDQSGRLDFLTRVIDTLDGAAFAAVVDGPAILTGLDPQMKQNLIESLYKKASPDFFDELGVLDEVEATLNAAIRTSERAANGYQDPALTQKIEREAKEATEAAQRFAAAFEGAL